MAIDMFIQRETRQIRIQSFAFLLIAWLCFFLCSGLAVLSLCRTAGKCEVMPEGRLNPNDAPAALLEMLPGIGMVRAEAIAAYREDAARRDGNKPAFRCFDDLQKVKGIGPKTVQNMSRWLRFE
jgi:competence ComEA-like helix-hairpin-helix protein